MRSLAKPAAFVLALWTGAALADDARRGNAAFVDPPILPVAGPQGFVVLDAFTDWVEVPGLGRVEGASFYDLERAGAAPVPQRRSLMPRILEIAPGTTVEVRLRNHLTTLEAADLADPGKAMPDATNIHTHGLIVPPTGIGFGSSHEAPHLGDCVYPLAASTAHGPMPSGMDHKPAGGRLRDACAQAAHLPADMGDLTFAGDLLYSYAVAKDHPSGLFWIHPHPHTQSEVQLSNGLSGLLAIGSIWDYLAFDCRVTASPYDPTGACATQDAQRRERELEHRVAHDPDGLAVRYLALKDIQVRERADSTKAKPHFDLIAFPHRPAMKPAPGADDPFGTANDARKALCGTLALGSDGDIAFPPGTPRAHGVCWAPIDPKAPAPRSGWVFPVSGQVYPQIEVKADMELWRLANTSADVTYRLQLVSDGGAALSMQPVALDGVALASPVAAPHDSAHATSKGLSTSGRGVTEITLMPSARTEVLVRRCAKADRPATDPRSGCLPPQGAIHATLRTRGVLTGATDQDGDFWPAIDLARFEWDAPRRDAQEVRHPRVFAAGSRAAGPAPTATAKATSAPAVAAPPEPTPGGTDPCAGKHYGHGPGSFSIDGTQVRLIRLNNKSFGDDEVFGIHDELLDLRSHALDKGHAVRVAQLVAEGAAQPQDDSGKAPDIADIELGDACQDAAVAPFGDNDAAAMAAAEAAFKTYYRPFAMDVDNVTTTHGVTEYWLVINDAPECHNFHIHQMKFATLDADFMGSDTPSVDQCAGDRKAERPINQRALQDNIPLPPKTRVLLKIDFDGPKLGRFVFHCHILEHEDKGMMATIRVADPTDAVAAPN